MGEDKSLIHYIVSVVSTNKTKQDLTRLLKKRLVEMFVR